MKINLNKLASEIAKADNPAGYNANVVHVKVALKGLGDKLRRCKPGEAFAIVAALTKGLVIAVFLAAGAARAQEVNVTNAVAMPSFSQGLQLMYDSVATSTNWSVASGFLRATTGNRNVGFGEVAYNFNSNVALIGGYEYLWTSKKAGIPSQANLLKGGLNLQANLQPLKQFGLTNFTVTPFAFALVASGNGKVSEIIGGGVHTVIYTFKGFSLGAAALYENRTGSGFWDGRYVGGMLDISHGLGLLSNP